MYNKYLLVFIQVADAGSFNQASQRLFISPNAVMKQINHLEDQLGIKPFKRTNHGLELTSAGQLIYQDAKFIIRHSDQTLNKARQLANHEPVIIRIGSSLMRSGRTLIHLWHQVSASLPNMQVKVVPFEDEHAEYLSLVTHLGERVDVIAGIYPSDHFNDVGSEIP